jgi:hypothetical protein
MYMTKLHLEIVAEGCVEEDICNIQDALFTLMNSLMHQLEELNVDMHVSKSKDFIEGAYSEIIPGDISSTHCVAFLTDPLRMIRNLGATLKREDSGREPKVGFKLTFMDQTKTSGKQNVPNVRDFVRCSGTAEIQYSIFSAYFDLTRRVNRTKLFQITDMFHCDMRRLCIVRMSGNKAAFRDAHKIFDASIERYLGGCQLSKEKTEVWCKKQKELEQLLPTEVDTSKFG